MLTRIRGALTRAEWARAGGLAAAVIGLHVVGFGLLFGVVVPHHFSLGAGGAFTAGVGLTAYTLGMRHAFDADHIAAIDNTTRKFMQEGQRPLSVGFFFALGHSTVVFVLALLLSLGVKALAGPVQDDGSTLHSVTGLIGTGVSGTFLYVIAALNLVVLIGILRVFRDMRRGALCEDELEDLLQSRGLMNRFLGRFTRAVRKPWHMYPLGILFGLGFDTATEVALLFLAAGAAGAGLPWYAIVCLPVLFAAGMSLFDTIDGSFMNFAYGWAFSRARAQGLLQPHHHRPLRGGGAHHRHHRAALDRRRPAQPARGLLGLGVRDRPQRGGLHRGRALRGDVGRGARGVALRAPGGALGAAGLVARARLARATRVQAGHNGTRCSASSTSTAPSCSRPPRRTRRRCSRRWAPSTG